MPGNQHHDLLTRQRGRLPWRWLAWGGAYSLLLIPLVAMQFTPEVNWTGSDFLIFGLMLGVVGGGLELALRLSSHRAYRAGAGIALGICFFMFWINGAVGIIGSENNPLNRIYEGVILVAFVGALLARLRAGGLVWACGVAALAQLGTVGVALAEGAKEAVPVSVFFTLLWVAAALLFREAASAPAQRE
jgi:hypothetical protein